MDNSSINTVSPGCLKKTKKNNNVNFKWEA
jgi:hypothetical protein